jgi:periplasmic divalent cation tolerance protein
MVSAVPPPAPGGPSPSFQERFAALSRDWHAQLPARLDTLQVLLQACRQSPDDARGLEEFHRQAHTLAGSAGTFGLHAVGEHARVLEQELERLMARPTRATADFDDAARELQVLLAAPQE